MTDLLLGTELSARTSASTRGPSRTRGEALLHDHQRDPRLLEGGGGQARAARRSTSSRARWWRTSLKLLHRGGPGEGPAARSSTSRTRCRTVLRGDAAAAAPDADQPGRQRAQVHGDGLRSTVRARAARRSRPGVAACCRASRCATPASASHPTMQRRASSSRSPRRTAPPRAATAAPGSGSPSAGAWSS